jgi:FkbM family methyltransferase
MSALALDEYELNYFNSIKNNCYIIFDVGSSNHSIFFEESEKEVHYFEPYSVAYNQLPELVKNKKYFLNNFGLSDKVDVLPLYQEGSLYNRNLSNHILENCHVKLGLDYCIENKIEKIDFLKIDVEGFETKVFIGFGDFLKNVRYIQFEYGHGLRDAGSNLKEVMDILKKYGFVEFYKNGIEIIESDFDFWEWCNITSENVNFKV